jgi:quinol monooxygenase YgiN
MVTGRFEVDAAQREAFLAFAHELVAHERGIPGIVRFEIYEDVTARNTFLMFEQWEDHDAYEHHQDTETFDANEARLAEFVIGEPSWDEYEF